MIYSQSPFSKQKSSGGLLQDSGKLQQLTSELEISSQLLDNANQEGIKTKQELARYRQLYEETNIKTKHMKDTINLLIQEIEKLNVLISTQDQKILNQQQMNSQQSQYLDDYKRERVQLIKCIQSMQSSDSTKLNEMMIPSEFTTSKSDHIDIYQLNEKYSLEIKELQSKLDKEKELNQCLKNEINQLSSHSWVVTQIEKMEEQLALMGKMLDQKQNELDMRKSDENKIEELEGQVQHFKELNKKCLLEFNQYRICVQQQYGESHEICENQIQQLKFEVNQLEVQNSQLKIVNIKLSILLKDEEQIKNLMKDLGEYQQQIQQYKIKISQMAQLEQQVLELQNEQRNKIRRYSPQYADDRISSAQAQTLQLKNQQLQQYLKQNEPSTSPFKVRQTVRKQGFPNQPLIIKHPEQTYQNFTCGTPQSFQRILTNLNGQLS